MLLPPALQEPMQGTQSASILHGGVQDSYVADSPGREEVDSSPLSVQSACRAVRQTGLQMLLTGSSKAAAVCAKPKRKMDDGANSGGMSRSPRRETASCGLLASFAAFIHSKLQVSHELWTTCWGVLE